MEIRIDYLVQAEQVLITNNTPGNKEWRSLYVFICDYIPSSVVSYSEWSISFAWRYFISIKGYIGYYIKVHRNELIIAFTDKAKQMMAAANDTSYATSLKLAHRTAAEIAAHLESVGFIRKLTENQLNNLEKIS